MHADLKWLAENVSEWRVGKKWACVYRDTIESEPSLFWSNFIEDDHKVDQFNKAMWQDARESLGLTGGISDPDNPFTTPDEDEAWAEAERRMDAIGQNGNDGLHYNLEDVAFVRAEGKQPRYQDATGEDWIDEAARTFTVEEFRGAMRFSIGKYNRRMGKKDDLIKEIEKMRDYCQRWIDVEKWR